MTYPFPRWGKEMNCSFPRWGKEMNCPFPRWGKAGMGASL